MKPRLVFYLFIAAIVLALALLTVSRSLPELPTTNTPTMMLWNNNNCTATNIASSFPPNTSPDFHTNDSTTASQLPKFKVLLHHVRGKHSEVYYAFVHTICELPDRLRGTPWDVRQPNLQLEFYLSPGINDLSLHYIWKEYNESIKDSCGPVFLPQWGESPKEFNLTIMTTVYGLPNQFTLEKHNPDPRIIYIMHFGLQKDIWWENKTNVYFLTPTHRHYIVPWYFPPFFTSRKFHSDPHMFVVQGALHPGKRNLQSLVDILDRRAHQKNFGIRVMGNKMEWGLKKFDPRIQSALLNYRDEKKKISEVARANAFHWTNHFLDAHAMLFLIDETNFESSCSSGRKLTSSISWAVGFGLKLVIYDGLANVFQLTKENYAPGICTYNHSKYIVEAFDECNV